MPPKEVILFSGTRKGAGAHYDERRLFICSEDSGRTAEVSGNTCALD